MTTRTSTPQHRSERSGPLLGSLLLCASLFLPAASHAEDAKKEEKSSEPAESTEATEAGELDLTQQLSGKDGIDFVCESDIYYSWKRNPLKDAPASKEVDTFFTTVGEHGLVGIDVRERLNAKIPSVRSEAMTHCQKMHQDQSQCIMAQLRSHAQEYTLMDFKARAAVLSAVQEDCAKNIGSCTATKTRPIKCYLNRPPDIPLAEKKDDTAEGETEKKDKKKK